MSEENKSSLFKAIYRIRKEIGIAVAAILVAVFVLPPVLRFIDPTSAIVDGGILHLIFLGAVGLTGALVLFWILLNIAFHTLDSWSDGEFSSEIHTRDGERKKVYRSFQNDFAKVRSEHRLYFFLGIFATCMLTFALCVCAVL